MTELEKEIATVSISLSPECAREVRARRKAAAEPNIPRQVTMIAYYETMFDLPSTRSTYTKITTLYYERGVEKARLHRERLNGCAWVEQEIEKIGSKWFWWTYREGFTYACGEARTWREAHIQCETKAVEAYWVKS